MKGSGMIRVGIIGGSGYTGSRLAYHLSRHTGTEIAFITSRQEAGRRMSDLYGALGGLCDLQFVDPADVASFVSLLLDPRAASVNGAILNVDGGEESAFGHLVFKNSSS